MREDILLSGDTDSICPLTGLMILRMLSTFIFGIFYSSITLILMHKYQLLGEHAVLISSLFIGLHFALQQLGGVALNRISPGTMFMLGKLCQLLGISLVYFSSEYSKELLLGLSLFLVDSSASTVSLNKMIDSKYKQEEREGRGKAFLGAHVWANIGFALSYIVAGASFVSYGFSPALIVAALVSFTTFTFSLYYFIGTSKLSKELLPFGLIAIITSVLISFVLHFNDFSRNAIVLSAALFFLIMFMHMLKKSEIDERNGLLVFGWYLVLSFIFWSIYMLGPTLIPALLSKNVNMTLLGFDVAPQWAQLSSPLAVVLIGGIFLKKASKVVSRKFSFLGGLVLATLALLAVFWISTMASGSIAIVLFTIVLLASAETLLVPASMSSPGDLVSGRWKSGLYRHFVDTLMRNIRTPADLKTVVGIETRF